MHALAKGSVVRWVALTVVLLLFASPFVYLTMLDPHASTASSSSSGSSSNSVASNSGDELDLAAAAVDANALSNRVAARVAATPTAAVTPVVSSTPVVSTSPPVPLTESRTLDALPTTPVVASAPQSSVAAATAPAPVPAAALAPVAALPSASAAPPTAREWGLPPVTQKALFFSMDSLSQRVEEAKRGGAAGEITVRESLQRALRHFGISSDVAGSDPEFLAFAHGAGPKLRDYAAIFLDPWTFVDRTWSPHPFLVGAEHKLFIMDFFGKPKPEHGLRIAPDHILTPFPTPWGNGFLGFLPGSVEAAVAAGARGVPAVAKKNQGVVWGKRAEYFRGKEQTLLALADLAPLHITAQEGSIPGLTHRNIVFHGHVSGDEWRQLLAESKFLVGLGDPLLGPSALDAVVAGCVFINPTYTDPRTKFPELTDPATHAPFYLSQHPYLAAAVGAPYVCTVAAADTAAYVACVRDALAQSLPPFVPPDYTRDAYLTRVERLLKANKIIS